MMHTAVGFLVPNVALRTLFVGVKKRRGILRFSTSHSLFVSKQKIISGKEERKRGRAEYRIPCSSLLLHFLCFLPFGGGPNGSHKSCKSCRRFPSQTATTSALSTSLSFWHKKSRREKPTKKCQGIKNGPFFIARALGKKKVDVIKKEGQDSMITW